MNINETYMSLPSDMSGSTSKNRFRLELLWGISKMFDIYDQEDFTIIFDNVCDIEIHFKSSLEFYQIKTHKVQHPYTFAKISKIDKDSEKSIIGKLYILKKDKSNIKIALVSNAFFQLGKKVYSGCEQLDFDKLDDESKKKIETVLEKEIGDKIDLTNFYYIYTSMNLLEPENDLKGKIIGFFEKVKKCEPKKPNALYRLIYETAKEKACYELTSSTYDEIINNKGLTKTQLDTMLNKYEDKTDVGIELTKKYIEETYNLKRRKQLKQALVNIVEAMYSSKELQQREIEISNYILHHEQDLPDNIEGVVDVLMKLFSDGFSIEYGNDEIYVFILLIVRRWEDGMYE